MPLHGREDSIAWGFGLKRISLSLSLSIWLLGLNWGMTQIETGCSIRPKLVCNFLIKKGCQVIALLDT